MSRPTASQSLFKASESAFSEVLRIRLWYRFNEPEKSNILPKPFMKEGVEENKRKVGLF
jgi:hypothetical protein